MNDLVSEASEQVGQYYIHASQSLQERRPRTLKHGDTFAVFDPNGDIVSGTDSPDGLYHADTRHLSHFDMLLGGNRPMLLSSVIRDDNAMLTCDLANPDIFDGDRLVIQRDVVHVRRSKFLWNGRSFERVFLRNFSDETHEFAVDLRFAADFADVFEVRGTERKQRGRYLAPEIRDEAIRLGYRGLDGKTRVTLLRFAPRPELLKPNRARFGVVLPPFGQGVIFIEVACEEASDGAGLQRSFLIALRSARRALKAATSRAASVATSNDIFNEAIRRSVSDLAMLVTDMPEGPYPYAGIPWFCAPFGRDAIITALELLWLDPAIARGVLLYLAANQATEFDPAADAEPGKILHEVRRGEMAELGEVPFRRYYGSVDSTPLFVLLAGEYVRRTGDIGTIGPLWPNILAALRWIDGHGDRDGDGFVEYGRRTAKGLINQGWKDSHDSIFHADGRLAEGPIAVCEVQAYVFGAKRAAAEIARRLGDAQKAADLEREAEALRAEFEAQFWLEDLGTYALALDGMKRPCRVRSSNAGHVLLTGLASPERASRVARTLLASASFSGWGIRTIASTEARYNPMSYHNGSVWPHDNALIALGMARYGMGDEAARIFHGLFDASVYIDLRRLPELFCGFPRRKGRGPTFYPVACSPQAWAAAAPIALLQACLGLGFEPDLSLILFDRPVLPAFLNEAILRRLSLGDRQVDVQVRAAGGDPAVTTVFRKGDIRVAVMN
ncbi:MAG TPA: amylo-alpha-1,6-glucosidase [Propylenella sp.]